MSRHLRDILGYAVAAAVQAGAALLAVPILTRWLSPAEFGHWSLLEPLFVMVAQVSLLGVNHGVLRSVGEDGTAPAAAWRGLLPWALASAAVAALIFGVAGWLAAPGLLPVLPFMLALWLEAQSLLALAALRAANRSFPFAAVAMSKSGTFLLVVAAAYFLPLPFAPTAANVAWMLVGTTLLGATVGVLWCVGDLRQLAVPAGTVRWQGYASAVGYGAPLMLAGLATAVTITADRYVLAAHVAAADVGRYVVLVKVASAINLLATPLNMWFPSARFKHVKDADGGARFFRRCALAVFAVLAGVAGVLWLAGPALVTLLNPTQLADRAALGWLLLGAVATALAGIMNVGILAGGRTKWSLYAALATGVLQIALLVVLTPRWGLPAAALSTGVAGCVGLALQNFWSQRLQRVPFAYATMAALAALAVAVVFGLAQLKALGDVQRALAFAAAWAALAFIAVRWDGARRK